MIASFDSSSLLLAGDLVEFSDGSQPTVHDGLEGAREMRGICLSPPSQHLQYGIPVICTAVPV